MNKSDMSFKLYIMATTIGALWGLVIATALLLAVSAGMLAGKIPESAASVVAMAAAFIGSAGGGFFSGRKCGGMLIPAGLGTGVMIALLLILAGALSFGEAFSVGGNGVMLLIACTGALIGSLLSAAKQKGRRKR